MSQRSRLLAMATPDRVVMVCHMFTELWEDEQQRPHLGPHGMIDPSPG
jgi:hypothetical protein